MTVQSAEPAAVGVAVWGSPQWRETAVAWLDEKLDSVGITRTGAVEQPHLRPWATALRAPTSHGVVWLKAAGPSTAFEVGLYRFLAGKVPAQVLEPITIDTDRSWIVLPDGGPTLGDQFAGEELVEALVRILPQYGQLQRDLAPSADDLVAIGVPDMRAAVLPERFDQALQAVGERLARAGTAADRERYGRVVALRGTFTDWCRQLAASPIRDSLDHNDLHPWNIFAPSAAGDHAPRFYDWGDAVVAHPFASLLVALRVVRHQLGAGTDDPRVRRLRDAYLEAFTDLAPATELVATAEVACRAGHVARALSWDRIVRELGDEAAGEYAAAPTEWLFSLLGEADPAC